MDTDPGLQKASATVVDFVPVVGDAKGFLEVFTGRDLVSGEELGGWRFLGLLGLSELRAVRHTDEAADVVKGLLQPTKIDFHHIFPQEKALADQFAKLGIDIDKYTVELTERTHLRGLHGKGGFVGETDVLMAESHWNDEWKQFFKDNPRASAKDVYQYAGQLMDKYGLADLPIVPYPH